MARSRGGHVGALSQRPVFLQVALSVGLPECHDTVAAAIQEAKAEAAVPFIASEVNPISSALRHWPRGPALI